MITYSTCTGCKGPLIVHDEIAYQRGWLRHHDGEPPCVPAPPTQIEWLCQQYVKAIELDDKATEAALEQQIWDLQRRPPRLGEAALLYASWGWPVFPLAARSKVPAIRGGHGCKSATTDADQIQRYWSTHPDHNIGLATGFYFDVIDIDREGVKFYHEALDIAAATSTNEGPLPDCHGKVVTANAGYHLYVKPSGRGNSASKMAPGIDYRGRGGYVVAPPSTLGEPGKAWGWLIYPSPMIRK